MNDVIKTIKSRRSIRKWKEEKVSQEMIDQIVECGLSAPSSMDSQPWEIVVLTDEEHIKDMLSDRVQLKDPPYDIDHKAYAQEDGIEKYEPVRLPPVLIVLAGNKELCPYTGSFLTSLACCGENMLLAAHALGLGSCWLYVYDPDTPETEKKLREKLGMPDTMTVLCLLPVGYPDEVPQEKELRSDAKHQDVWG